MIATEGRTAIIVKGYPRLSETFIAQEILALQDRGQRQLIVSLRRPTDPKIHALNQAIRAPVLYLPEYLHEEPLRVAAALAWAVWRPGFIRAARAFLADLIRDPTRNRVRRFGQAAVLARELPRDVVRIYSHYLHTPASVARYAARIRRLPWSFSAHAKDIWTTPAWDLREKLVDADWGVTCTAANAAYLNGLNGRKVELVYHGLDFSRFPAPPARPPVDGRAPDRPVRLLSVGRAVEKKGYDDLLSALALLPDDLHWRLSHIGSGPLLPILQERARALGLADRIDWRGAQTQDAVVDACRDADLFVLAAKVAADGDRDGMPNVLMEAQAMALCCLSTRVAAIPELIEDGVTGRLVPPGDPPALAEAMRELIADPAMRQSLATAGAARVRSAFGFDGGIETLSRKFGLVAA